MTTLSVGAISSIRFGCSELNGAFSVARRSWKLAPPPRVRLPKSLPAQLRCSVVSAAEFDVEQIGQPEKVVEKLKLVCPICQQRVVGASSGLNFAVVNGDFNCRKCRKTFPSSGGIIDLTIPSNNVAPLGTSLFQNPFMAYIYERGYRDQFSRAGFLGFDEEARRALDILELAQGQAIMDLSCGPGGFTRRFASSGKFDTVVAADFSMAMLEQARGFIKDDKSLDVNQIVMVRADAARLPFETSSLAGVHAAAAIHCWPNVQTSVAEISRVLQPGGVFVASTFLGPSPPGFDEALRPLREAVGLLQLQMRWFVKSDLQEYVENCGLVNFQAYVKNRYILFSATKPE